MTFEIHSKKYGVHIIEIDDEDAEKVLCHTWRISYRKRSGRIEPQNVRTHIKTANGRYTSLYLHRLIVPEAEFVDHISGNVLDNRKSNLRACNASENMRNRPIFRNNKLGLRGVYHDKKTGKFHAQIQINKKRILIGKYDDTITAARAYNEAAIKYHGEFARLNDIEAAS